MVAADIREAELEAAIQTSLNSLYKLSGASSYMGDAQNMHHQWSNDNYPIGPAPGSTSNLWNLCAALAYADPYRIHVYRNHFHTYNASDWTITADAGGSQALDNQAGGVLLVTNDGDNNDKTEYQLANECWKIESDKPLWFEVYMQFGAAVDILGMVAGLCITDADILQDNGAVPALTDGIYFHCEDGDTSIDFTVEKDSAATNENAFGTLTTGWHRFGFRWDGSSLLYPYIDGVNDGTTVSTNIPDDEELTITVGVINGDATARTMEWCYAQVVQLLT